MKRKSSASPAQISASKLRSLGGSRSKLRSPSKRKESDISTNSKESKTNVRMTVGSRNYDGQTAKFSEIGSSN